MPRPVLPDALEACPDALFTTDADGRIVDWGPGAQATYGYSAEEAIGKDAIDLLIPGHHIDGERDVRVEATRGPQPSFEALRVRRDGTRIYVNATLRALYDDARLLQGFLHRDTEITHLRVRQDTAAVATRYGTLLNSTPDAIIIVNDIGRIVLANVHAEALFAYEANRLLGHPIEVLLPERFQHRHVAHRTRYFDHPRTRPMGAGLELYGRRSNGEEFPVEISLSPLDTDKGRFGMSAIRDISERKRFEKALHDQNVELERASRAKDRFLASMSHELRTPLNAIIGFTSLLLMRLPGPLTADQEKQLEAVRSSGKHLLALINDLLDVARIESGHVDLSIEPVICQDVVREVLTALELAAQAKGLALDSDMPTTTVIVQTDRRALHQILLNLGNNAVKYTQTGRVCLSVSEEAEQGRTVTRLSVLDTGPGIPASEQHKLFKAFSQVTRADADSIEGTGLGLYLCQQLAQLIGGHIEMHSVEGQGSRFTLVLEPRTP